MQFHFGMEPERMIDWLRDSAVRRNMPPQFIAAVDDLYELADLRTEIDELTEQNGKLENAKDDLRDELEQATDALRLASEMLTHAHENPTDPVIDEGELRDISRALQLAEKWLDRHK